MDYFKIWCLCLHRLGFLSHHPWSPSPFAIPLPSSAFPSETRGMTCSMEGLCNMRHMAGVSVVVWAASPMCVGDEGGSLASLLAKC